MQERCFASGNSSYLVMRLVVELPRNLRTWGPITTVSKGRQIPICKRSHGRCFDPNVDDRFRRVMFIQSLKYSTPIGKTFNSARFRKEHEHVITYLYALSAVH